MNSILFSRLGFTADAVQSIVQLTVLNPWLTLPLYLLGRFHTRGLDFADRHPIAFGRLALCLGLGLARWANNFLTHGALNNWSRAEFKWDKELVVVTGGSDGIGKIIVGLLAERGFKVVVMDIKRPEFEFGMKEAHVIVIIDLLFPWTNVRPPDTGKNIHYVEVDLALSSSIDRACGELKAAHGDPTVLLLNAGIFNTKATILDTPDDALTRLVAVNQLAHYRLARAFVPSMAARNHGMIVTTASQAGYVTPVGMTSYCATKAAAVSFHEGLGQELRHRYNAPRVRTMLVNPSFTRTRLLDDMNPKCDFLSPTL